MSTNLEDVTARGAALVLAREHVRCGCGHVLDDRPEVCPDCGAASSHPHGPYLRRRARGLAFGLGALAGSALAGIAGLGLAQLAGLLIFTTAMVVRELPPRRAPTFRDAEAELRGRLGATATAIDRLSRAVEDARLAGPEAADAHAHAARRLHAREAEAAELRAGLAQIATARVANRIAGALHAAQDVRDFEAAGGLLGFARAAAAPLAEAHRVFARHRVAAATIATTAEAALALELEAASARALLADPRDPPALSPDATMLLGAIADAADLLGARVVAGELDAPRTAVADERARADALDLVA